MPEHNFLSLEQKEMIRVLTQALPDLRKEASVTQTTLAQKVGVSRQTISMIERQLYPMSWTLFLAIVFFFRCNHEFETGERKITRKYPNLVDKILLLEHQMNGEDNKK